MRESGKIHAAKLETSARLQAVVAYLKKRGAEGATTREIVIACDVCAVNSIVDEIRENGIPVFCKAAGRSQEGANVYRYYLEPPEAPRPAQGDLFAV